MNQDPISVCITRTVKPGCEADFEQALHDFVQRSLTLPGQMGVHIMRPAPGSGLRDYGIIRRFANRAAVEEFRMSPEYLEWNQIAVELTEGVGRAEELSGLESWFTAPGAPLRSLPKWKMAVATVIGVYPASLLLGETVGRWTHEWPIPLRALIVAIVMVVLLTWVMMPLVTRLLHGWLHPGPNRQ